MVSGVEAGFEAGFEAGVEPDLKRSGINFLLTGGGGNHNYAHWLLDVLPRLKLVEKNIDIKKIKYFLFP